ncbi:GIY-YIG nuclease family protein [Paenibacillus sp. HN-1]|nr:GIY-YIG nuclease family protein [Paenibacillus sp. CGMCC 1.18879]MBY9083637.1 GIY-YIG nuclease family protein [Paenibacillus sinensis]
MKEKAASLPQLPGVYLMKDSLGHIIYVGKSKNLKKRVQSYFYQNKSHSPKVKKLVGHIRDLEHRVTDTEFEAFMLECRLIHELKPMYNRKMKNPLGYPYILIGPGPGLKRIKVSADLPEEPGWRAFGPYTSSRGSVERAVQDFRECFGLACNHAAAGSSACLNHSLGLCRGACLGGEAEVQYHLLTGRFAALLAGEDGSLEEEIKAEMVAAAERFDFEAAARYRDCLGSVGFLLRQRQVARFAEANRKLLVMERIDEQLAKLFLIRRNLVLYSETFDVAVLDELPEQVEEIIRTGFAEVAATSEQEIGREEFDEAQIIYSYLKGSSCRHLEIHDDWLGAGDSSLREEIGVFLRSGWPEDGA